MLAIPGRNIRVRSQRYEKDHKKRRKAGRKTKEQSFSVSGLRKKAKLRKMRKADLRCPKPFGKRFRGRRRAEEEKGSSGLVEPGKFDDL
jgi:hypothetical protein